MGFTSGFNDFSQHLYKAIIEPRQTDQTDRNRELLLNITLLGTAVFMIAVLFVSLSGLISFGNLRNLDRVITTTISVAYIALALRFSRMSYYNIAAYAILCFYTVLACICIYEWGVDTPLGIVLLGFVIVLANIALGSRRGLYASVSATFMVLVVQSSILVGLVHPRFRDTGDTNLSYIFSNSLVFGTLAILLWLFVRQMEFSLRSAEATTDKLAHQKQILKTRISDYSTQLRNAQIEEARQLHQFAEVGQMSAALLHDLANHLTVLTLQLDGMADSKHSSEALKRSREITLELNAMLDDVRDRLTGDGGRRTYNLIEVIDDAIKRTAYKDRASKIRILWDPPEDRARYTMYGDPIRCYQIIAILISNAIDAYDSYTPNDESELRIAIYIAKTGNSLRVTVTDWGIGIPSEYRDMIFQPTYTTKKSGKGIGLYLAKQLTAAEFSGALSLSKDSDRTEFVLTLPKRAPEQPA